MDLSIVIVNYKTPNLTIDCISSIRRHTKGVTYEILVVDNGSGDDSIDKIRKYISGLSYSKCKLLISKTNLGFAAGNNLAIKKSQGKYILLLNSDTLLTSNVAGEMINWLTENPHIGIASCSLKNSDGSEQGTGGGFPYPFQVFAWMFFLEDLPFLDKFIKPFHLSHNESPFYKGEKNYSISREFDWLTGAFFMVNRKVVTNIGLLDEEYFMYTEEVDFCYRAKKIGWKVFYNPKWSIVHFGGASSTSNKSFNEYPIISEFKGVKLFYKKHMPKVYYPFLRILLKLGSLMRIFIFGLLKGKAYAKVYAKSFIEA